MPRHKFLIRFNIILVRIFVRPVFDNAYSRRLGKLINPAPANALLIPRHISEPIKQLTFFALNDLTESVSRD